MSTINGVSGSGNVWAALNNRSQMQAKMFAKVDTDGSGSVDQSELQTMLSDVSQKTGVDVSSNTAETFKKFDANGDGKLNTDELDKGMQSILPTPTTVDFAQSRGSDSSSGKADDLFSKLDTNGDGTVNKDELKKLTDKIKADTGQDTSDAFSKLDSDSDGKLTKAEFEAGRPQKPAEGGSAPQGAGGPPPAGGPGGAGGSKSASSDSQTYDPLDTNQDGTVSELERLVGDIQNAATSASSDSTDSNASSLDLAKLAKQLYEQFSSSWSQQSLGTLSATA